MIRGFPPEAAIRLYDSLVKTRLACIGILLSCPALSQIPPAETPLYPAGAHPSKALPTGPRNLDFHEGTEGGLPAGWFVPRKLLVAGYGAELSQTGCKTSVCAIIITPPAQARQTKQDQQEELFGNLMQTFDASAYRGKRVHFHSALRLEPSSHGAAAQMWLRVDCEQGQVCEFDNMGERPVRSNKWKNADIKLRVPESAVVINIGVIALGHGRAWIDEVVFVTK
jgi:hypothetical protein